MGIERWRNFENEENILLLLLLLLFFVEKSNTMSVLFFENEMKK